LSVDCAFEDLEPPGMSSVLCLHNLIRS
jgi:hypothetical protein